MRRFILISLIVISTNCFADIKPKGIFVYVFSDLAKECKLDIENSVDFLESAIPRSLKNNQGIWELDDIQDLSDLTTIKLKVTAKEVQLGYLIYIASIEAEPSVVSSIVNDPNVDNMRLHVSIDKRCSSQLIRIVNLVKFQKVD